MKYTILFLVIMFLLPSVNAETTFFDQDDTFIMGNSPTTTEATGRATEGTSGGSCKYEWNCTNWSECLPYGNQTRTCTNTGSCSDTYKVPEIEQNCMYSIPKSTET